MNFGVKLQFFNQYQCLFGIIMKYSSNRASYISKISALVKCAALFLHKKRAQVYLSAAGDQGAA